jgi:hypothetical protein
MISLIVFSTIKIENTVITYFIQFMGVCKGKPRVGAKPPNGQMVKRIAPIP